MNLTQFYLTKNDCYKQGRTITVQGIVVHSTGANNPNINRYVPIDPTASSMHWDKPGLTKCVHAFVGYMPNKTIGTVQTLPWNMRGWHVGPGTKGSYNNSHIGFEICEDGLTDQTYFDKVFKEAAELCAYLCNEYNLNPMKDGVIVSHHESYLRGYGSNHADCDHWLKKFNLKMDDFREYVNYLFTGGDEKEMDFKKEFDKMQDELAKKPFSEWAQSEDVPEWCEENGISKGGPQCYITREQCEAMIKRAIATYNKSLANIFR